MRRIIRTLGLAGLCLAGCADLERTGIYRPAQANYKSAEQSAREQLDISAREIKSLGYNVWYSDIVARNQATGEIIYKVVMPLMDYRGSTWVIKGKHTNGYEIWNMKNLDEKIIIDLPRK